MNHAVKILSGESNNALHKCKRQGTSKLYNRKCYRYYNDEDGNLAIDETEAKNVRLIYNLYLQGKSVLGIVRELERLGIKSPTGKATWPKRTIDVMLSNDKYMGDVLQQKTYTIDFLTKKRVNSKAIVPQYYIEDDHEAIIHKELYYQVQEEKARRASLCKQAVSRRAKKDEKEKSKYSSKFALSDIMVCRECGQPYRRQIWSKYGQKNAVWRYTTHGRLC